MKALIFTGLCVRRSGTVVACTLLMLFLSSGDVLAQQSLTLQWALQQTLEHNIELKAYPFQHRIADAQKLQAELRPLPTVNLEVENVVGNGTFSSADQAEVTLTLSQVIELGEKRKNRIVVASASQSTLQTEYELARLDVLAETSRRFYAVLRLQSLERWINRRIEKEERALEVILLRAEAGAVGQADVSKIHLRLARSQALKTQLGGQLKLARITLSSMWSARPDFVAARGNLLNSPVIPDTTQVNSALELAPEYLRSKALQRLADAQVQLARANGRADLNVGMGVRHIESSDDQSLVFNVSMPIPFSNTNRGRIAAADAVRELAIKQSEEKRTQLRLSLLSIQQILTNHNQYSKILSSELLPQAHQLLEDTESGYRKGRYSVLQWTDAQAELFALERELIETNTLMYLQVLELERLTGQSMSQYQ